MSALDATALIREFSNCQRSDLQANPSLADNQYVKRVFGVMPKNEMGEVTFDVFVRTAGVQAPIPSHFDFQHVSDHFCMRHTQARQQVVSREEQLTGIAPVQLFFGRTSL